MTSVQLLLRYKNLSLDSPRQKFAMDRISPAGGVVQFRFSAGILLLQFVIGGRRLLRDLFWGRQLRSIPTSAERLD